MHAMLGPNPRFLPMRADALRSPEIFAIILFSAPTRALGSENRTLPYTFFPPAISVNNTEPKGKTIYLHHHKKCRRCVQIPKASARRRRRTRRQTKKKCVAF